MKLPRSYCLIVSAALFLPFFTGTGNSQAGFVISTSSGGNTTLNFGDVLVGDTGTGTIKVANQSTKTGLQVTFPTPPPGVFGLSGSSATSSLSQETKNTPPTTSRTYTYTPTTRGLDTQTLQVTTNSGNKSIKLQGQGVAPVNQVKTTLAPYTRIGTTGVGQVVISNIGDGNKSGVGSASDLKGQFVLIPPGSPFSLSGTIDLKDHQSKSFSYMYTPTHHGKDTLSLPIVFSDGSSDGKNHSQQVNVQLSSQGVGPVYSAWLISSNSSSSSKHPAKPQATFLLDDATLNFGKVSPKSHGQSLSLEVRNLSTDLNGGKKSLTDLTLLGYKITGPDAKLFSLSGFSRHILDEGKAFDFKLNFIPNHKGPGGWKYATLTLFTDQNAAFGGRGETFTYDVKAFVTTPAPSSFVLMAIGLFAALTGCLRRRRAALGSL